MCISKCLSVVQYDFIQIEQRLDEALVISVGYSRLYFFIYLGFYVAFNTVQVVHTCLGTQRTWVQSQVQADI